MKMLLFRQFSTFFTKKQNRFKLLPHVNSISFNVFSAIFSKFIGHKKLVSTGFGQSAGIIYNVSRIAQSLIMHAYLCFKNFLYVFNRATFNAILNNFQGPETRTL